MRVFDAGAIDAALDWPAMIDAVRAAFAGALFAPPRHHLDVARVGATTATQLIMPAWSAHAPGPGSYLGTKIVGVFPDNGRFGLSSIQGAYLLQSGETGQALAALDGNALTAWRTAGTSALAASYLARPDASRLLMMGAGALAPRLIAAHASVRPINQVTIWNHRRAGAERLAARLADGPWRVSVCDDPEAAARAADVISCATLATAPLLRGDWLRPGQHVDLVGSFNRRLREADDEAIRRARIFVDTPAALTEGGDVAQAIDAGVITAAHAHGELADLARGAHPGRRAADEITLFKSIGASIEDLAAAILVWERAGAAKAPL